MKKLCLLTAVMAASVIFVKANVFTVSNNLAHPTGYTDIQSAINAASAGDSVYVIGSLTQYAGITISTKINLFGPGFLPQKNNVLTANVNGITISAGADGTLISGMVITNGVYFTQSIIGNITLTRNNFYGSGIGFNGNSTVTNLRIINNVMVNGGTFLSPSNVIFNNFLVENNVIANENSPLVNGNFTSNTTIFKNNVIMTNVSGGNGTYPLTGQVEQVTFSNNIFVGWLISNGTNNAQYCTFDHNLAFLLNGNTYSSDPFTGGGSNNTSLTNIYNQNPGFVNVPLSNPLDSSNYQLAAGSPALTAASDGGQQGVYGGDPSANWSLAAMPNLPYIYSFILSTATINAGGSITATVIAKSHN